jgi:hypothetical protein
MKKNKKRLLWAAILLLLFLPPCYYFRSSFVERKAQLESERLLVKKQIIKPAQPAEGEEEAIGPDLREEGLTPVPAETPEEEISVSQIPTEEAREARLTDFEASIRRLEQELLTRDKKIEDWKRRWEEKIRELEKIEDWKRRWEEISRALERYERELMALRKESLRGERKPAAQGPPARREEIAEPGVKEKGVVPPLMTAALEECEGVPISHRNLTLILCKGLHLGSNLSYDQAVVALNGLGIAPTAGWNRGNPSFPIGADELEEILSRMERAVSIGLAAVDHRQLMGGLKHYCKREKARVVGSPQCEGPMVTECVGCEISQCDLAIYVAKVLGIGEALNCDQSFVALTALGISPRGGWRVDEPYALTTQREIEEVRCSVREAYGKGCIGTDQVALVASVNEYCLWLKMNIRVVGEGSVAEAGAQTGYQGGSGEVPSGSQ